MRALFIAAALTAALTSGIQPASAQQAGARLHLALDDATEVVGVLISSDEQSLLLRTDCGELAIPRDQIEQMEVGTEVWFRPYRVAGNRRFDPSRSAPSLFRRQYLDTPVYRDYQEGRLQLTDSRFRWVGPSNLGYSERLLGRSNRRHFRIVEAGVPYHAVTLPEVVALFGDSHLTARYDAERRRATRRLGTGFALVGAGTAAIILGSLLNYAGEPDGPGTGGQPYGAPLISGSVPLFIISGIFLTKGLKRTQELEGADVSELMTRREAWTLVQDHNGELRRDLGLPDDERLDAP